MKKPDLTRVWFVYRDTDHADDDYSHTLARTPGVPAWENDAGHHGYGLTLEEVKYLARATRIAAVLDEWERVNGRAVNKHLWAALDAAEKEPET